MKLIAITGSIGTGKTTAAQIIRELGYNVYDMDGWVRRLYYQKDFIARIAEVFPEIISNGRVDKKNLRQIVFDDSKELEKLEALIHPFLRNKLKKVIRRQSRNDFINFMEVPLLFEKNWDKYVDMIIVTTVAYEIQKQRVMIRDNVTGEHFDSINKIQMNSDVKALLGDVVVDTDKPLNLLKEEIIRIIEGLEKEW